MTPSATGGDDLHGGEEERREPRRAIRCSDTYLGQHLKLFQIFVLALQSFDHAHALDVFVVCARDLRVGAAAVAEFHQNLLAELHSDNDHDRDDGRYDQCQAPVDDRHENQRCGDVHEGPGRIHHAPCHQVGHASAIGGDARDQSSRPRSANNTKAIVPANG